MSGRGHGVGGGGDGEEAAWRDLIANYASDPGASSGSVPWPERENLGAPRRPGPRADPETDPGLMTELSDDTDPALDLGEDFGAGPAGSGGPPQRPGPWPGEAGPFPGPGRRPGPRHGAGPWPDAEPLPRLPTVGRAPGAGPVPGADAFRGPDGHQGPHGYPGQGGGFPGRDGRPERDRRPGPGERPGMGALPGTDPYRGTHRPGPARPGGGNQGHGYGAPGPGWDTPGGPPEGQAPGTRPVDDRSRVVRPARPAPAAPDDGNYVPPEPPPLPMLSPAAKGAWAALFGGPGYLLVATMAGWSVPGWAAFLAVAAFVGGFAVLVIQMGERPPRDSGPDDGAVV